jgi:hypothetical protein
MHRLVAILLFASAPAIAATGAPDGGVDPERARRGQQAVDDMRVRLQTNDQVAANLTPDERLMLLSGIICDAKEKAEKAREVTRKERAKRRNAESIDSELVHDQEAVIGQQQARISHARRELGRLNPTGCKSADMRVVVSCIRGKNGPVSGASSECGIPEFWKYRRALMDLDPEWRNLLFPTAPSQP